MQKHKIFGLILLIVACTSLSGCFGSLTSKETVVKKEIHSFYGDDDMQNIVSIPTTLEVLKEEEKYLGALKKLKTSPDKKYVALWSNVEFISATLKEDQINVNMHLNEKGHLGSAGELLAIEALKKALFQFSEVNAIEILVDGETEETLMGHIELEHPYRRK